MAKTGVDGPDEEAFFLSLPAGWSMVDYRRLPDPAALEQLALELDAGLPSKQIARLSGAFDSLRKCFKQVNVVLMAVRAQRGGTALDVLTVACPTRRVREPDGSHGLAEGEGEPQDEAPGVYEPLPDGSAAIVHHSTARDHLRGDLEWSVVQLVTAIPETELPVIMSMTTTDAREIDVLTKEVCALAATISRC